MVEVRSNTVLPADRQPVTLQTADGLSLVGELRRALEADELELQYQPQVDVSTGAVVGVEALVRWRHPQRGLLAPSLFIPAVEHTALIGALTSWVLDAALAQARRWADAGTPLRVAVNLSTRNLMDKDLPEQVAALLVRHGVSSSLLELEVTESAVMIDPERAGEVLRDVAALGVGVSLDDFGASRAPRKLRELEVFRALSEGRGEDVPGLTRIEAPAGVHVIDYVTQTWLPQAPRPLVRRPGRLDV